MKEPKPRRVKAEKIPPTKKIVNTSLKRRIVFYPNQRYFKMHVANSAQHLCSRSEMTQDVIKKYYDNLPVKDQQDLLRYFESMTPEQIANTRNIDNLK
jgi:hypothetical protein